MLSTTYIVDVYYEEEGKENVKKSIFVKVPLTGDASKDFKQVRLNIVFTFEKKYFYISRLMFESMRCIRTSYLCYNNVWMTIVQVGQNSFTNTRQQTLSLIVKVYSPQSKVCRNKI